MTSHPSHLGTWTLPTGEIGDIYYSPEMIDVFLKINKIAPSTSILDIRIEWKGRRPDFRSPGVMQHWKAVVIPEVYYNLATAADLLERMPAGEVIRCPNCQWPAIARSALYLLRGEEYDETCRHCQHRFPVSESTE